MKKWRVTYDSRPFWNLANAQFGWWPGVVLGF